MSEPQYRLQGIIQTRTEEREDFEGPLDVIFLLLSKNKIEIQDVSITAILEQYLAYLDERKRLDMEIASEFITMASHLMLIKTKMLLSAAEQAEAQTELDLLRKSLEERARKEAIEQIRDCRAGTQKRDRQMCVYQGAGASAQGPNLPLSAQRHGSAPGAGYHRGAEPAPASAAHRQLPGHRGQRALSCDQKVR